MPEEISSPNYFRSEIDVDFSKAKRSAEQFDDVIYSISQNFNNLSKITQQLNTSFVNEIKRMLNDWKSEDLFYNLNLGDKFRQKIEKAVVTNLARSEIAIKEQGSNKIFISQARFKQLSNKLVDVLVKSFANITPEDLKLQSIKVSSSVLNSVGNAFLEKIRPLLNADIIKIDDKTLKSFKIKVSEEDVAKLTNALKDKIIVELSKPEFIQIPDIPPIKIDGNKIAKALENIKNSLEGLDEKVQINLESFENMPAVDRSLGELVSYVNRLIKWIGDLSKRVSTLGKNMDSNKLLEIEKSIADMQNTVLDKIMILLEDTRNKIRTAPIGTIEAANIENVLIQLRQAIEKDIAIYIGGIRDEVMKSLDAKKLSAGKKKGYVMNLTSLVDAVNNSVQEILKQTELSKIVVNSDDIAKLMTGWSQVLTKQLQEIIAEFLVEFSKEFIVSTHNYFSKVSNNIINALEKEVAATETKIDFPVEDFKNKLAAKVSEIITALVKSAYIAIDVGDKPSLKVSRDVKKLLQEQLNNFVSEYVLSVVATLNVGDVNTNRINKVINQNMSALFNSVLNKLNEMLSHVVEGGLPRGLGEEEKQNFSKAVASLYQKVFDDILNTFKYVLGALVVSNEVASEISKQLNSAVAKAIKSSSVDVEQLSIDLSKAAKTAARKVYDAVRSYYSSLEISPESINVNVTPIVRAIERIMSIALKQASSKIVADVNKVIAEQVSVSPKGISSALNQINTVLDSYFQAYVNNVVSAIVAANGAGSFKISVANLLPEVRKRIAQYFNVSVRELFANMPILEGGDAIKFVIQQSMDTIWDRFHDTLFANTNTIIREYQKALSLVEVTPNVEVVDYLSNKMISLQKEIVSKIRKFLDEQFKLLHEEIKNLKLYPRSLGYTPPQKVQKEVESLQKSFAPPRAISVGYESFRYPYMPSFMAYNKAPYGKINVLGDYVTPGGDTRSFVGSVINTMRYITAGALVGYPSYLIHSAYSAAREFDYNLEKARQNFLMKDMEMLETAERRIRSLYESGEIEESLYENIEARERLIREEAKRLKNLAREGAVRELQNLAEFYGVGLERVGEIWHIASRRIDNPEEALVMTRGLAKLYAYEREGSPEEYAKGLEALFSQWQLSGYSTDKIVNMLIKTASLSQVTVEELLEIQKRAGAVFAQNMPGVSKEEALATSFALSSLFIQSTARSGEVAGTFWRTVFEAPFDPKVLEYLKQKSQLPGFENLYPYVRRELPTGEVIEIQKTGKEMFINILEALQKMDDRARHEFIKKVYGERFGYGTQAMEALIEDLDKIVGKNLEEYIEAIRNVKPEEITAAIMSLRNTFEVISERNKAIWDSAMYEIFENLKDDFASFAVHLSSLLRMIRDNADLITELIRMASRIAIAEGMKWIYNKGRTVAEQRRLQRLGSQYMTIADILGEEGRFYEIRKLAILEEMDRYSRLQEKYKLKQMELQVPIARRQAALTELSSKIALAEDRINELRASGASERAIQREERRRETLLSAHRRVSRDLKRLQSDMESYERVNQRIATYMEKLNAELVELDGSMGDLSKRARLLDIAFSELGMRGRSVSGAVKAVNMEFLKGGMSLDKYEMELKEVARAAGVSESKLGELRREVDMLVKSYRLGKITAEQFAMAIRNLERAYTLKTLGVPGDIAKSAKTEELVDMVIAGSMYKDMLKNTSSDTKAKGLVGNALSLAGLGALLGRVKLPGLKGVLSGAGNLVRGVGVFAKQMAPWLLLAEAVDIGARTISRLGMDELEELELLATEINSMVNATKNVSKSNLLGKAVFGVRQLLEAIRGGLAYWMTGKGVSFGERMEALRIGLFGDEKQLEEYVKRQEERLLSLFEQIDAKREEDIYSKYEKQKELQEQIKGVDPTKVSSFEDAQQIISRLREEFDYKLTELETEFKVRQAKLLLSGAAENSDKVRKLMDEFLQKSIEVLREAINQLEKEKKKFEKAYPDTYKDNEVWRALNLAVMEKQAEIAELELRRQENEFKKFDAIMERMENRRALIEAEYGIKKADSILSGISEDSLLFKRLEALQVTEENKIINATIEELRRLMERYSKDDWRRERIFLQIKQLQAEARDNLARIYKALTSGAATFNLPPEIKPITYWEAMTRNSNYRNVTIRSGDVIVNVTINSSSTRDINRVAEAVTSAARRAQAEITELMARQVRTGIQYSYR